MKLLTDLLCWIAARIVVLWWTHDSHRRADKPQRAAGDPSPTEEIEQEFDMFMWVWK